MRMAMGEDRKHGEIISQAALEHIDALYGYAMVLTRNQTAAEDLVQETYLRAVRGMGQLVPNSNLKSWLFVIMRNAWLNQLRHERSGPAFVDLSGQDELRQSNDEAIDNPHVVYLRKLERAEIKQAIETLPDLYREIVVLRDIEGFSYQEIAGVLGCPAGTVMSRLGRARARLRQELSGWQTKKKATAV